MLACLVWAIAARRARHPGPRGGVEPGRSRHLALSVMGVSVPVFWVDLLLSNYVGGAGCLPGAGPDLDGRPAQPLVLPAATLGAVFVGPVAPAHLLLDPLGADYVRGARARARRINEVTIHCLRNAAIPVVTLVGWTDRLPARSGSIVTRTMFAWPGSARMAVGTPSPPSDFPAGARARSLVLAVRLRPVDRSTSLRLPRSTDSST